MSCRPVICSYNFDLATHTQWLLTSQLNQKQQQQSQQQQKYLRSAWSKSSSIYESSPPIIENQIRPISTEPTSCALLHAQSRRQHPFRRISASRSSQPQMAHRSGNALVAIVKLLLCSTLLHATLVEALRFRPTTTTTTTTTTTAITIIGVPGAEQSAEPTTPPLTTLTNCCPAGALLVRRADDADAIASSSSSSSSIYRCATAAGNASAPDIWGYLIRQQKTIGANGSAESTSAYGIPACDGELRLQPLHQGSGADAFVAAASSCLAYVEHTLTALACVPSTAAALPAPPPPLRLSFAHKCCPLQHTYSINQRRCTPHGGMVDQYDAYAEFFGHPAVFQDTPLDCPPNRVLIEQQLRAHQFTLPAGELWLSGGTRKRYKFAEYCVEAKWPDAAQPVEFLLRTCEPAAVCKKQLACIRRCCDDGEMFAKGSACRKDETDVPFHSFESLEISGNFTKPPVFGILRGLECSKYRLDPDAYEDEAHSISERDDGALLVHATQKHYTNAEYCVEKIRNATWGDQKLYTFLCFDSKVVGNDRLRFKMYPIGLLISCSFYVAVLLVYLSIPKLRNLPGQILICLVCSLFAAYLSIALGQLMPAPNDHLCFAFGFFVYFCLMAAFAWMNVMCFDIWQTFGTAKSHHGIKGAQTRRFLLYSLYGWGWPTLLTVIAISLAKSNVLSEDLRPQFGHGRCWFTYDTLGSASLLFFSGPIGILFLINFALFSLTLRYCNKVKREIFRMQSSNNEKPALRRRFVMDKARFAMNTKLFVVMGITWLLELLSIAFYDHKKTFFWVISDSFNVLLGVFVFFIFVFKKRVWGLMLERFGLRSADALKRANANLTCATPSTCMQSMSMTRLNAVDGNTRLLSSNPGGCATPPPPRVRL